MLHAVELPKSHFESEDKSAMECPIEIEGENNSSSPRISSSSDEVRPPKNCSEGDESSFSDNHDDKQKKKTRVAQINLTTLDISTFQTLIDRLKFEYDEIVFTADPVNFSNLSSYHGDSGIRLEQKRELDAQNHKYNQANKILEANNFRIHDLGIQNEKIHNLYGVSPVKEPDNKFSNEQRLVISLKRYIDQRLQQEIDSGSQFNGWFGWSWFSIMGSPLKRSAAQKLINFIEYEASLKKDPDNEELILNPPEMFTENEIRALKDRTLAERLKQYGYDTKLDEIQEKIYEYIKKPCEKVDAGFVRESESEFENLFKSHSLTASLSLFSHKNKPILLDKEQYKTVNGGFIDKASKEKLLRGWTMISYSKSKPVKSANQDDKRRNNGLHNRK